MSLQARFRAWKRNPSTDLALTQALNGIDPLVRAFRTESGATDVSVTNEIIEYARAEGFLSNLILYPLKSAQNAGSGSTAYGVGGLTTNDMTLNNSPTWGSDGLSFNGTSQNGEISDFLGGDTLTVFVRLEHGSASPTAAESLVAQFDGTVDERSFLFNYQGNVSGDPYRMIRSSDGTTTNQEVYESTDDVDRTSDQTLVVQWINSGGRNLWQDKTQRTLSLTTGSAETARNDSSAPIGFAAVIAGGSPTNFSNFKGKALCFVHGSLTSTQREKLTDLINKM